MMCRQGLAAIPPGGWRHCFNLPYSTFDRPSVPFTLTYDLTAEPDASQSRPPQGFSDGLAPSFPNVIGRAW
jgi:hypothetical protein